MLGKTEKFNKTVKLIFHLQFFSNRDKKISERGKG